MKIRSWIPLSIALTVLVALVVVAAWRLTEPTRPHVTSWYVSVPHDEISGLSEFEIVMWPMSCSHNDSGIYKVEVEEKPNVVAITTWASGRSLFDGDCVAEAETSVQLSAPVGTRKLLMVQGNGDAVPASYSEEEVLRVRS